MSCCCERNLCVIPVVLGIIAGLIAVVIGSIPSLTSFLWIVFGISLLILTILAILSLFSSFRARGEREKNCICKKGICLLAGAFGALITSIIALTTGLTTTAVLFFLVGFFAWELVAWLVLIICLVMENCN